MVNQYGEWFMEKDYKIYPKNKWCDYDYIANWIKESGYQSKTSIENIVKNIFIDYENYLGDNMTEFYLDDIKESENYLMVSIKDISSFVYDNGGLEEFDYKV